MNPFEKPEISKAKRILAVQPHYDDNDIAAGGTLACLVESGADLFYLTVTNDLVGVLDLSLNDDEAEKQLREEQRQAGEIIGVKDHFWLGYSDAGRYDYFDLRKKIMQHIRMIRPDLIFTCDPWMPYEAHNDHIQTGRATAEAAILFGMPRIATMSEVDEEFSESPFEITGVAFYATSNPNTIFDISETRLKKHSAIEKYETQFSADDMQMLLMFLNHKEEKYAQNDSFSHAEPLKVLRSIHLHGYPDAVHT